MVSWLHCFESEVRQNYHGREESGTAHFLAVARREERGKERLLHSIRLHLLIEQ
jgi:hypothetical protein